MWEAITENVLPNALMIGVDYELFWTLNPKSLSPFFKAFSLRQEYDDRMAWLHGRYVLMAIGTAFSKDAKYPSKPLLDNKSTITAESKQDEIKRKFMERMEILNTRFRKEDTNG